LDLLIAVDDLVAFHRQNLKENYQHYTYFARVTKGYPVFWFQAYGAKVHLNTTSLKLPDGEPTQNVTFRYGVLEYQDLIRDLKYWETLAPSTYMQRPYDVITVSEECKDEIKEA
jgi:translocator assembly and maintenance protein 41